MKNKLIVISILFLSMFFNTYADTNKDYLILELSKLETNFWKLKTTKSSDLEWKILKLSNDYDSSFVSLWYEQKIVNYLVALWKLNSSFKKDMATELNTLNAEISTKISNELLALSSVKNNILINYTTVSETDKAKLQEQIDSILKNYTDLDNSFSLKISALDSKYSSNLNTYKTNLKSSYDTNKSSVDDIKNFDNNYNELNSLYNDFQKNYTNFKNTYLTYASDLSTFSQDKQNYYVELLKKELNWLKNTNIEANKSLEPFSNDLDRLTSILLENFKNWLKNTIESNYWIIYSQNDIDSLNSRFLTVKNRYYDKEWNILANEVLNNTWAILEINNLNQKIASSNSNIKNLLWANTSSYENIKIILENEMIKYYNSNYVEFRKDLVNEIKQKLNVIAQDTKNMILAVDNIDIRYNILSEKIKKMPNVDEINKEIVNFKNDMNKYSYLNNNTINTKIFKNDISLRLYAVNLELIKDKYSKMTFTKYKTQIDNILNNFKTNYPNDYKNKLMMIVDRIDLALQKKNSTKNQYLLLSIKNSILNFINL